MTTPTQEQTQAQQQPGTGQRAAEATAIAVGTGVALSAIAHGAPDPFLPLRWARLAAVIRAERRMVRAYRTAVADWLPGLGRRVVHPGGAIDPHAVFAARGRFAQALEPVEIEIREAFSHGFHDAGEADWQPDTDVYLRSYLDGAVNRLRATPDHVYAQIKREVATATRDGDDLDELAARIEDLFADNNVPTWRSRGLTVARTETLSAYNAGAFASAIATAQQTSDPYDKVWLATEDERTRPTHREADLQRVPLMSPFRVGGFPATVPGDPTLPAQERINCRCTPLFMRAGERLDLSNRQFRGLR